MMPDAMPNTNADATPAVTADRYARAAAFCEWNVRRQIGSVSVTPHWLRDGERFWYERRHADGSEVVIVDPARGTSEVQREPPTTTAAAPPGNLRSPDGRSDLRLQDGNLYLAPADSDEVRALTHDGATDHGYGLSPDSSMFAVTNRRTGIAPAPVALWSPDSRLILTHRLDQRGVPKLHLLESVPSEGFRPLLHSYRMPFASDPLASAQLLVIDAESGEATPLDGDPLLVEFLSPIELGWVWWSGDGHAVWFLRETRGAARLSLCVADARSGSVREVLAETADTYVETSPLVPWPSAVRLVRGDTEIVWPSERDGWRHLYLFDAASGDLIRQLTAGEWLVRDVVHADGEWVWFTGLGHDPDTDPYLRFLYRVRLDGGGARGA